MSLSDIIFGERPELRGPTAEERSLGTNLPGLQRAGARLAGAEGLLHQDLISGRGARRRGATGRAAADVSQQFARAGPATNRAGAMDRALARGRGLSRVTAAAGNRFDMQLLRDRIATTRQLRSRQGEGFRSLLSSAGIQSDIQEAIDARARARSGATANLVGTVAGAGLGAFLNRDTGALPADTVISGVDPFQGTSGVRVA